MWWEHTAGTKLAAGLSASVLVVRAANFANLVEMLKMREITEIGGKSTGC